MPGRDDLTMRGHVLQKGAAQILVVDPARALLEQPVGGLQDLLRARVVDRAEHLVAGQVDAQGLQRAFELG